MCQMAYIETKEKIYLHKYLTKDNKKAIIKPIVIIVRVWL